jgi:hypothetical protein
MISDHITAARVALAFPDQYTDAELAGHAMMLEWHGGPQGAADVKQLLRDRRQAQRLAPWTIVGMLPEPPKMHRLPELAAPVAWVEAEPQGSQGAAAVGRTFLAALAGALVFVGLSYAMIYAVMLAG